MINAGEALEIVPEDAPQTTVGFLDFAGEHGEQVTEVFTSVNPRAAYDLIAIENGNWAEQLIGFVDGLKEGGEERGIVNLSFDLTQTDVEGRTTTRYELTEMEQKAIAYARENNILLVAAAGNTGDRMSALGAASEQFDNIITVGAVNKWEETADYSARGQGLTLVATGGQWESDRDAFVGTSKATSYVTGAASLVWAANPDLNYQQVKDLLISTATDLGEEGWDTETGAGLLDVADAVMMAGLATPLPLKDSEIGGFGEFSGEGRVDPNERAVSDKTEKAIADLSTTQNRLIDEWTVLWLLGNPELTLDELDTEVKTKVEAVLGTYQEASTEAAKNSARVEQLTEALTLATSHDRIERERLQSILTRQQDLIALVAQLSQQKAALEQGSAQQKAQIEDNIVKAEEAIAQATAKLDYLLIDPQTLLGDADELRQQATAQLQLGQTYRQQAQSYESDRQNHEAQAKIHDEQSQKWQVVGYTKSRSGSRKEKWGWVTNTEQVKLRDQHQWEAEIAAQNAQTLGQLAAQLEQQGQALNEQANLVENNNIDFSQSQGKEDDADRVLELLQQQAETQTELASAYWQQAEMLEKQRIQNQRKADWHKEQSRRWEVVGYKKKFAHFKKEIWGWREYPEHIPLMQQAQQLADTASQELAALQQLAHQTQQESDRLTQQVERLDTLVNEDWQKIKQGIEYEIIAQENRLQGEKDLLALTTAKTEQDLATLALKMSQTETELSEIESDRTILEQSVTQTEQRLNDMRSQWEKARKELASTQQNLQQFLDTSGHFLPYRERLIAVETNIEQLELEKVRTEGIIAQLQQQFNQNPVGANNVRSLEDAQEYLEALERDLQWAKIQQDSFSLSALDSPQRLELKALLKDLEDRQAANISSNSLPLRQYLDFLQQIETGNTNLLTGFDDLQTRLTQATGEQTKIEEIRDRLQEEYRKLGLEKTNINAFDFIPKLIEETNTDLQEQQDILRDRQTQIDDAYGIVEQFEKQRQEHQEQAEYWDSKINQWEIVGYQKSGKSKKPVYDWVYHPEAEAQRDTELAAAETAAQQRDEATLQTQTLEMSLQPEMEVIQGKIAGLELKRTVLETSQNSSDLEQQITDKETEIGESLAAIANEQIVLSTLTDSTTIAQQQQKLSELDRQLDTQQQERDILAETLAYREQLLQAKNSKLSDKYREIELTEGVLAQIEKESDRLQSRLDLINRADELETQFKTEQEQWQESSQAQITAIDELLATREQGESDRAQLLALRSQLSQVQGESQQAQTEIQQLEPTVTSAQEVLALTDLQLGNQELQLQSLNAQDAPLQSAEAGLYNLAEQLRQKIWEWDGSKWKYIPENAAEYRQALQGASLMADRRNQLWPKIQDTQARIQELTTQQVQQQTEVQQLESQLSTLENKLPQLETQATNLKTEIAPIAERLKPLEILEQQQVTAFKNAAVQTQENAGDLAQTTDEQVQALRRLISFGILASESDVDFFFLEIEPKIQDFRDRLQQRNLDFTAQAQQLNQLITSWEQDLANTTDDISRQAITAQIDKAREQVNDLATWKSKNETAVSELENYFNQANNALKSLRLQQELQVRQEIASNEKRVESLQAQLRSENATELALNEDTVLAYADLGDRVREDLETVAKIWTENLQLGHNKTKELGEQQGKLSQSVDDLIAEIENNFADPHGEYKLSQNELRDAIATLGILAPRSDELGHTVTSAEQSIEKILIHVQEDAKLWQEIAPIATRYGLESQEFAEFEQKYQWYQDQDRIIAEQYEQERQNHQQQVAHWESQINTWGVIGYKKKLFGRKKTIYGWIHNPEAEVNRNAAQAKANDAAQKRDSALELPQSKVYRDEFLNNSGTNGAAIAVLQERTKIGREEYQPLYENAKAKIAEGEAAIAAGLAQADWYEKQAAIHLAISEKLGPDKQQATWTEDRRVKYRGRSGKTKWKTVTITHVNHDWIVWDNYTKLAADLRKQAAANINELASDRYEKERWEPLSNHWSAANDAANQAATPINEAHNLFEQLEAERESLPQEQEQLNLLQNLLPTLKQQLTAAQQEADAVNAKVLQGWLDYDTDAAAYRDAIATIQTRRGELDRQAHTVQNELVEVERWVENQNVALAEESEAVDTLRSQLQERLQEICDRLPQATGNELQELQAKEAQLARSLQLLTNKAAVLTEQKTTLTQKRVLLTAQNEVILAEQRLLDAYLVSPDDNFSALQQQLQQARTALAEAQRLAEKAASDSVAITDPLQATQADLLAKNDAHLQAAKEKQAVLKGLLEATQLNANYTLEAFQKQQELNDLEFQVLQRLQAATIAGNDEAQHLLEVAQYTSLAAAAEIYHRDYRDLASDNGSRCSGGLSRPEDRMLADQYYQEWLNYNELKRRAEEQASAFTQVREAAETEIASLQEQQEAAANRLNELNGAIATTEEEIIAKEQELAILEARVAGLERLREQTEQTFIQLLTLEQLNLSQAQLEQQLAQAYQEDIDRAVKERLERDRLEVARHRLETQAKIEQLRQLQAEENLRLALNQVRSDVGLASVDGTVDAAQLQGQLAGLLSGLQALGTQQATLPDNLQALLAETQADIYLALQGDESKKIESNLLKVAEGLIEQVNQYKTAIAELEVEEQQDEALLQQAEQDLQGATLQLLQEIEQSQTLGKEREILTPLNLEVLQKVAYAEQAIDISEDLAKYSKDLLNQIIEQRKEERKARKKAFVNETLGVISLILDIIAIVLTITGIGAPIAAALRIASAAIKAFQAAYNGDWAGALYQITKAILGALIAADVNTEFLGKVDKIADAVYKGYRAHESGDNALAFLQIVKGIADVAAQGYDFKNDIIPFDDRLLITLGQVSVPVYQGIGIIEKLEDDITDTDALKEAFNTVSGIFKTFSKNFAGSFVEEVEEQIGKTNIEDIPEETTWDKLTDIWKKTKAGVTDTFESADSLLEEAIGLDFEELIDVGEKVVDTGNDIAKAIEEDSLEGWLNALNNGLHTWENELTDLVDNVKYEPEVIKAAENIQNNLNKGKDDDEKVRVRPRDLTINNEQVYYEDRLGNKIYPDSKFNSPQLTAAKKAQLWEKSAQDGYVVFYEASLSPSRVSPGHAGVVAVERDSAGNQKLYVVESVPKDDDTQFDGGIRKVLLKDWLDEHQDKNPTLHKPQGWTEDKGAAIGQNSLAFAKKEENDPSATDYSIMHSFFGKSNDKTFYCTLFVEKMLDLQGIGVYSNPLFGEKLISPPAMKEKIPTFEFE